VKAGKKVANILLDFNIFIAICAVALVLTNQITVTNELHFDDSCWFIFSVTMFTYFCLKRFGFHATGHFTFKNCKAVRIAFYISLAATIFFFFLLPVHAKIVFLMLLAVTAVVGFIKLPFTKPRITLNDLSFFRIVFVAVAWSVATVVIPLSKQSDRTDLMIFLMLRSFLFILAITMAFDIKDMQEDRQNNFDTLPLAIGVSNTKLIAQAVLFLLLSINTAQYFFFHIQFTNMMAINLSVLLAIVIIQLAEEETADWWYYFVLDGLMIMQFIFVYAAAKYFG
jgi:4-hydroxybenzoate polyprenyltransferase